MPPSIEWPTQLNSRGTHLLALQFQLQRSERLVPQAIHERQFRELRQLLTHATSTCPYYMENPAYASLSSDPDGFFASWNSLPLLSRSDVQQNIERITSQRVPRGHGSLGWQYTTGSSGSPVMVRVNGLTRLVWQGLTLRDHLWHKRDSEGLLAVIRATSPGKSEPPLGTAVRDWGEPLSAVARTGPAAALSIYSSSAEQAAFLNHYDPHYILTYPSVLGELVTHVRSQEVKLTRLKQLRTFGEILEPETRRRVEDAFGVPIADTYSCQELGYIALQCPETGLYHVQAESVYAELLKEDGTPTKPGEIGRVVLTSLHNYASPLIRYDVGDFAELADPCNCGRGLPTWRRIIGRQRQMVHLPDGTRRWFMPVPDESVADIVERLPPIQQFQVVQKSLRTVEAKFVTPRALDETERLQLRDYVQAALGHPFEVRMEFVKSIDRGPGGKFEEFRCEVE